MCKFLLQILYCNYGRILYRFRHKWGYWSKIDIFSYHSSTTLWWKWLQIFRYVFSQPSIYIDGWLYAMRMTSDVCNVTVLSQNDSTYHHSVFTTWKWHPFATWTPSFIILVWGHHPPLRRTVFAYLQNCYNSRISCSRSAIWFTLRLY